MCEHCDTHNPPHKVLSAEQAFADALYARLDGLPETGLCDDANLMVDRAVLAAERAADYLSLAYGAQIAHDNRKNGERSKAGGPEAG